MPVSEMTTVSLVQKRLNRVISHAATSLYLYKKARSVILVSKERHGGHQRVRPCSPRRRSALCEETLVAKNGRLVAKKVY